MVNQMRWIFIRKARRIIFTIFLSFNVVAVLGCAMEPQVESSGSYYFLSESDLPALRKKALIGDSEASLKIAQFYTFGFSPPDIAESMFWFRLSAEQGNSVAAIHLAELYKRHFEDSEKAIYWYSKVREREPILANNSIADLLWAKGEYSKSLEHYSEAAFHGSTEGMARLAEYKSEEKHGKLNYVEAYTWALLLAERLREGTVAFREAINLSSEMEGRLSEDEKRESLDMFNDYSERIPIAPSVD